MKKNFFQYSIKYSYKYSSNLFENNTFPFLEKRIVFKVNKKEENIMLNDIENIKTKKELEQFLKEQKTKLVSSITETQQECKNEEIIKNTSADAMRRLKLSTSCNRLDIQKNPEISQKIFEKAEKFKSTLSASHLLILEDLLPGTLKKLFTKEAEGNRREIDFSGNSEAESLLGLGDFLDVSQTYVCVYDARTGEYEYGVRGIKNTSMGIRPAYINMKTGKYIEILDKYKVEEIPASAVPKEEMDVFPKMKQQLTEKEEILNGETEEEKKSDRAKNETAKKKWGETVVEIQKGFIKGSSVEALKNLNIGDLGDLKKEIANGEGGYLSFNRGKAGDSQNLKLSPNITIREIQKLQKLPIGNKNRLFAVGKYQFTPTTLAEAIKDRGISPDEKFTPEIQEDLFLYLIFKKRPILGAYLRGKSNNIDRAMYELACEFASIPLSSGFGKYDKDKAGNKAFGGKTRYEKIRNILIKTREKISNSSQKKEKTASIETVLYNKKNIALYINPRESNHRSAKRNLENLTKANGYPDSLFIKNVTQSYRYTPKELSEFTAEVNKQYLAKGKKVPIIYIDNEHGSVQRITEYSIKTPQALQKKFDKISGAGSLKKGEPSLRSLEKVINNESSPSEKTKLMTQYAQLRIAQEKSLGLNSISLVLDEGGSDIIKSRGFNNAQLRKEYANILIKEAETQKMQVLLKHFPGHSGFKDPHKYGPGTRTSINEEMRTFIEILQENSDKKNITVMLGHIKISADGWDTKGELASQSKEVADKLKSINPHIKLITDDIGAMTASGKNKNETREKAQKAGITVLN